MGCTTSTALVSLSGFIDWRFRGNVVDIVTTPDQKSVLPIIQFLHPCDATGFVEVRKSTQIQLSAFFFWYSLCSHMRLIFNWFNFLSIPKGTKKARDTRIIQCQARRRNFALTFLHEGVWGLLSYRRKPEQLTPKRRGDSFRLWQGVIRPWHRSLFDRCQSFSGSQKETVKIRFRTKLVCHWAFGYNKYRLSGCQERELDQIYRFLHSPFATWRNFIREQARSFPEEQSLNTPPKTTLRTEWTFRQVPFLIPH